MTDPRELAQQAFSMLQNALRSSEARADELGKELARQPATKDQLSNRVDVLTHRLEKTEQECEQWKREAEQLEDVLANERTRIEQLKKKLDIAESGPDKLTKKEINYWRANAEKFDEQINSYKARIAALRREMSESDQRPMQQLEAGNARPDPDSRASTDALSSATAEISALKEQLTGLNSALATAHATRKGLSTELAGARERLESLVRETASRPKPQDGSAEALSQTRAELAQARKERQKLADEIAELNRRAQSETAKTAQLSQEHTAYAKQLDEAREREDGLRNELAALQQALTEQEDRASAQAASEAALADLEGQLERARQQNSELRIALEESTREIPALRDQHESAAAELRKQHDAVAQELDTSRQREGQLQADLEAARQSLAGHDERTRQLSEAASQAELRAVEADKRISDLEAELREEKEFSENLSELSNGRMDQINKLQDSVDEAQERLDDALWRLDKAKHFERLVARRKSLIVSLIGSLRARNKAMVALKAGLDSLRSHKALAEETQQKLLVRMEALKNELGAAKETIQDYQSSTMTKKELENSKSQISGLMERLKTQAELIQSLEEDLKTAKAFKRDAEEKHGEVAQLHEELETKSTIISRLQSDIDDQQRKLAKLRGSDSETMRLRAVKEQDRSKIEILERENAELRAMLESLEQSKPSGTELSNEREQELQAKIRELTEAVSTWKRKYEFLSTEAPAAYQTHTAAKK
jgi:chromosome segregation ATPase